MFDAFGAGSSSSSIPRLWGEVELLYRYGNRPALLGYRYYDASAGRFINRDPTQYNGGINIYGYVDNNSVGFYDPFGTDKWGLSYRWGFVSTRFGGTRICYQRSY